MKSYLILFFFFLSTLVSNSQDLNPDSLKNVLNNSKKDTNQVKLLLAIAGEYYFNKPESCLLYANKALILARDINFSREEPYTLNTIGEALRFLGDYPQALKMQFEALRIYQQTKNKWGEARTLGFIGFAYVEFGQYTTALPYLFDSYKKANEIADNVITTFGLTNIGHTYYLLDKADSALYYQRQAYDTLNKMEFVPPLKSLILTRLGNAYLSLEKTDSALICYHLALDNSYRFNDKVNPGKTHKKIADLYASLNMPDSSLYHARLAFASARSANQKLETLQASDLLVNLFRKANADSSFYYSDIARATRDSLYGPEKFRQLQLLIIQEQDRQQKIREEEQQSKNRLKYAFLLTALGIFLLVAFILFKSNRQKQKSNILLKDQKNKIEETLTQLKATQSQLIQSEKMASLGELTAGIAHEIQNPLNFINNFSDVNKELLSEMKDEIKKENFGTAESIANDIIDNEEKINHHGKRADAIVKGMLQHSRTSSGQKELTDINALCDEYLRLAYHGLKGKDKSFNAILETDFDNSIGKIKLVPQDIGRVVLNLINNAFYAVSEKTKLLANSYEPLVKLTTRKLKDKIEIRVEDNGNGIAHNIVDKIFQPFFTTKPTGKGTGLGLSLAYDIIKAHGGDITVETSPAGEAGKEGEGSEFIIQLPCS
jgi:two-component system NtrC family sensor kinase